MIRLVCLLTLVPSLAAADVFINEIDYDNDGVDAAEWIELAGTALSSLQGLRLQFLNASSTNPTPEMPYRVVDLSPGGAPFVDETGTGWGFFVVGRVGPLFGVDADLTPDGWDLNVLQNGAPDAVQLWSEPLGKSLHTIEYEGDNPYLESDQWTPLEDSGTNVRATLYLSGSGRGFADLSWATSVDGGTPGAANLGQSLAAGFRAADFDEDGAVGGADLALWKAGFGASGTALHEQGDADGDRDVDGADFLVWQRQLESLAAESPRAARIAEPAASVVGASGAFVAAMAASLRRRRIS